MLLYLRHGDDRGTDIYRHDRQLNDRGRKKARKAFGDLAAKYGHPDTLFVSPFRRSIQTLEEIATRFKRPVDVHRDPRIAQYIGSKRETLVSPQTAAVIALDESLAAFRARIRDHVEDVKRRKRIGSSIWCITHQIVIEEVARCFGMKIPGDLDFLDHVVMLG
jgi:broad specificity phosphatase PhoE